jgi:chemotaxis protein MotB
VAQDKSDQPIIIKRVKKVAGGAHGGVWKIAYADFVTAMMAFFLMMWVLGSTTSGDLAGISAYFQNPLRMTLAGGQGSGDQTAIVKGGGPQIFRQAGEEAKADSDSNQRRVSDSRVEDDESNRMNYTKFQQAKSEIQKEIQSDPELAKMNNQVFMDVTAEGLRIQIVDDQKRAMFSVGGSDVEPFGQRLLQTIGGVLKDMSNQVRIEGHTDSLRYGSGATGTTNWELSSDRANAARRQLSQGGLAEGRVSAVVGYADSVKLNPSNPKDPLNRRISIMVLNNKQAESPSAVASPFAPPATKGAPPAKGAAPPPAPAPTAPVPPAKGAAAPPAARPAATPAAAAPAPAAPSGPVLPADSVPTEQTGRTPVLTLPPRPQVSPSTTAPQKK